jgi:hypothetical protein
VSITHKPGELIALSSGEYSDYRFNGLYAIKEPIDLPALAQEYYDNAPLADWVTVEDGDPEDWMYERSDSGFGAFLIARGLVDEVSYHEVHCGSGFEPAEVARECSGRTATGVGPGIEVGGTAHRKEEGK